MEQDNQNQETQQQQDNEQLQQEQHPEDQEQQPIQEDENGQQMDENNSQYNNNQQFSHSQHGLAHDIFYLKAQKKNMEEEEIVLMNRIKKLNSEQETLTKKIIDTQKRAQEIYEIKKKTNLKKQEELRRKIEVEEIPFTQPKGQLQSMKVKMAKEQTLKNKQIQAQKIKLELQELKKEKQKQQFHHEENQKWRTQIGVQKKKQAHLQAIEQKKDKDRQIIDGKLREKDDQTYLIDEQKKQIEELEQQEQELIEQFKQTQRMQAEADQQLQFSLNNKPKKYEDKYMVPMESVEEN